MEKLPYVFLGSPPIGPIALKALELAKYPPVAVIDDPKLPLEQQLEIVEKYRPTFLLIAGYGAILKRPLLDSVAGQVLNIHPSFLPYYRGPAPVVQAILDGAKETGVTLMETDEKMDHGPILAQEKLPLRGDELPSELYQILTARGVSLFLENIESYLNETLELLPQNHAEATFTHFIKKEQGRLDLNRSVDVLERQIRAFQGWPRTWVTFKGKQLIVEKAHVEDGQLRIDQVRPDGKKSMDLAEFLRGQRLSTTDFYCQILAP